MTVSLSTVNDERTYNGRVFPHIEIIDNTSNTILREHIVKHQFMDNIKHIQFTDNITYCKKIISLQWVLQLKSTILNIDFNCL
jgi:hypothetical protein